jgi:Bacterial Ig-like domain
LPPLDFVTRQPTSTSPFLNGNQAANRRTFSITLLDLDIPVNDTFSLKWKDVDALNTPDDGPGIDDFSITVITDDIFPPTLTSLAPVNFSGIDSENPVFTATFSEPVTKNTGSIKIIKNSTGEVFRSIDINDPVVTTNGNTLSFQIQNLPRENDFMIIIDSAVIKDTAANDFAGIKSGQWNFHIFSAADTTALEVDTLFPSPGSNYNTNYVTCRMYFKEPVKKGYGKIYIRSYFNDAVVQSFSVDSPAVVIDGLQLYFKPAVLAVGTYYISFDRGAVKDTANNDLPVFAKTKWVFTLSSILGIPPDNHPLRINSTVPANGASDLDLNVLEIYWYEYVQKQYGYINIRSLENDSIVQQINVLSPAVNVNTNYTSIQVAALPGGNYYIEIMPGAFRNLSGTEFPGTVRGNWNISIHNYITIADGVWGNPAIWLGNRVPPYGVPVTVKHNLLVTVSIYCYSLKVLNPGSLTLNNGVKAYILH